MPRLNGKFVSQDTYDEAVASGEATQISPGKAVTIDADAVEIAQANVNLPPKGYTPEEITMSDEYTPEAEESASDRRRGPRPGTALRNARIAALKLQSKVDNALAKLNAHEAKRAELAAAHEAAQADHAEALVQVSVEEANL